LEDDSASILTSILTLLGTWFATVYYKGLENYGIENNVAYLSAGLSLWTLQFNLVDMLQVPLCDESLVADSGNVNACPGDGAFKYEFEYALPTAGSPQTSWLASGWKGSGLIQMFAQQDESMKIGECKLSLNTYVTQKSGRNSLIGTPSAAVSLGMVLAAIVVLAALGTYCYCCCGSAKRPRVRKSKISTVTYSNDDDNDNEDAAHFKRMEDEKSFWSGSGKGSKKSKKTESSSVVSDLP
jgi:hypothetical protein